MVLSEPMTRCTRKHGVGGGGCFQSPGRDVALCGRVVQRDNVIIQWPGAVDVIWDVIWWAIHPPYPSIHPSPPPNPSIHPFISSLFIRMTQRSRLTFLKSGADP